MFMRTSRTIHYFRLMVGILALAAFLSISPASVRPALAQASGGSAGCQAINNGDFNISRNGSGATISNTLQLFAGEVIRVTIAAGVINSLAVIGSHVLFSGNTGPNTAQVTILATQLYLIQSDIITATLATIVWTCIALAVSAPSPSNTALLFNPYFLNFAVNNHRSRFGNLPNGGNFFPALVPGPADLLHYYLYRHWKYWLWDHWHEPWGGALGGMNANGGDRRYKIADNNSPLPRDRTILNYNHLNNAVSDYNGDGIPDNGASRIPLLGDVPGVGRLFGRSYASDYGSSSLNLTSDQLLAQLEQRRRAEEARKLQGIQGIAAADALLVPPAPAPLWHFWVSGSVGEAERGPDAATLSSDIEEVTTGVYYTSFSSGSSTGGYLSFRTADADITGEFTMDGDAVGGALFHIRPLGLGILGKVMVFFESGDADVAITGATGSFGFDTWQIEGELAQHHDYGSWWMRSRTNLFYAVTDRDGFIDSNGAAVMGGETDTLRLTFGPTFGFRVWGGDHFGWLSPYLGLEGEWDIVDEGDALSPAGTLLKADPFNFHLRGGINSSLAGLGTLTLEASAYGGGGGDDEGHQFKGSLNVPLN